MIKIKKLQEIASVEDIHLVNYYFSIYDPVWLNQKEFYI